MSFNASLIQSGRTLLAAISLLNGVAMGAAHAADTPDDSVTGSSSSKEIAAALLETTGIAFHLSNTSATIFSDALPMASQCFAEKNEVMSEGDSQSLNALIEQHFGDAAILARAVNILDDAMLVKELQAVQAFFNTPVGVRIVAAEVGSKNFDERTLDELIDRHLNSSAWNEARAALMDSVYDSTRTARFVSTLNGEVLAAGTLGGHCDTSSEGLEKLALRIDTLRSEAQFVEPLMRNSLVPVMAAVFRNLPNSDLAAYTEFAQSELGVKFFDALLSTTASSLSEGAQGLQQSLQR